MNCACKARNLEKDGERQNGYPLFTAIYHSFFGVCVLSDVPDNLFKFFPDRSGMAMQLSVSALKTIAICLSPPHSATV